MSDPVQISSELRQNVNLIPVISLDGSNDIVNLKA